MSSSLSLTKFCLAVTLCKALSATRYLSNLVPLRKQGAFFRNNYCFLMNSSNAISEVYGLMVNMECL
jgi:hypothetical protein